jgi:hypothetical protein
VHFSKIKANHKEKNTWFRNKLLMVLNHAAGSVYAISCFGFKMIYLTAKLSFNFFLITLSAGKTKQSFPSG